MFMKSKIWKFCGVMLLVFMMPDNADAQTVGVTTNALGWAALSPNVGVYGPIGTESAPIIQYYLSMGLDEQARRSLNYFLVTQKEADVEKPGGNSFRLSVGGGGTRGVCSRLRGCGEDYGVVGFL